MPPEIPHSVLVCHDPALCFRPIVALSLSTLPYSHSKYLFSYKFGHVL